MSPMENGSSQCASSTSRIQPGESRLRARGLRGSAQQQPLKRAPWSRTDARRRSWRPE